MTDDATRATAARSRTFTWEDPLPAARAGARMDGLSYLRAILDGELPPPPIAQALGFELAEVEPGRVVFAMEPGEEHYNINAVVHGGVAATLCDSAIGCAAQSRLPAGTICTTLELKVNYIRALTAGTGRVTCEARTVHLGGRTAVAEARLTDAAGRLCAIATSTLLVMKVDPPPGRKSAGELDETRGEEGR